MSVDPICIFCISSNVIKIVSPLCSWKIPARKLFHISSPSEDCALAVCGVQQWKLEETCQKCHKANQPGHNEDSTDFNLPLKTQKPCYKQAALKQALVSSTTEGGSKEWHTDEPFRSHKFYSSIIGLGDFHDLVLD